MSWLQLSLVSGCTIPSGAEEQQESSRQGVEEVMRRKNVWLPFVPWVSGIAAELFQLGASVSQWKVLLLPGLAGSPHRFASAFLFTKGTKTVNRLARELRGQKPLLCTSDQSSIPGTHGSRKEPTPKFGL